MKAQKVVIVSTGEEFFNFILSGDNSQISQVLSFCFFPWPIFYMGVGFYLKKPNGHGKPSTGFFLGQRFLGKKAPENFFGERPRGPQNLGGQ